MTQELKAGQRVKITIEGEVMFTVEDVNTIDRVSIKLDSDGSRVDVENLDAFVGDLDLDVIPDPLPAEDGWYEAERYPLSSSSHFEPYRRLNGVWYRSGRQLGEEHMRNLMPLHRLGRVTSR